MLLLHGTRDRMVPIAVARAAARANPAWTLIEMPGVGHVPQLEAPDDTASAITGWLGSAGQRAAQAAAQRPPPGPHEPAAPTPAGCITTKSCTDRRNWLLRKNNRQGDPGPARP